MICRCNFFVKNSNSYLLKPHDGKYKVSEVRHGGHSRCMFDFQVQLNANFTFDGNAECLHLENVYNYEIRCLVSVKNCENLSNFYRLNFQKRLVRFFAWVEALDFGQELWVRVVEMWIADVHWSTCSNGR